MDLIEFKHRCNNSQNCFGNRLQAIAAAIEIVATINPQTLHTIKQLIQIISEYVPLLLRAYENLTTIADEFFKFQHTQQYSGIEIGIFKTFSIMILQFGR